jgi:antitoxin HigA-1
MNISQSQLASDIGLRTSKIDQVVRGERGIDADMALRLARYFGMSVEFWTGIQIHYEVELAKMTLADRLEREVKVLALA